MGPSPCADLGAYLVGALEPTEAAYFADHLTRCGNCAAEVAELAGLLPLLAATPVDDLLVDDLLVDDLLVDDLPVNDLVNGLPAESSPASQKWPVDTAVVPPPRLPRRSRHSLPLLIAAVVALLIAVALFVRPAADPIDVAFPLPGGNSVRVQMAPFADGSNVTVNCHYEAAGRYDEDRPGSIHLWITTDDGSVLEAMSWPAMTGDLTIPGVVAVSPEDVAALELRDSAGAVLVSVAA